jgi:hypothetical protein
MVLWVVCLSSCLVAVKEIINPFSPLNAVTSEARSSVVLVEKLTLLRLLIWPPIEVFPSRCFDISSPFCRFIGLSFSSTTDR